MRKVVWPWVALTSAVLLCIPVVWWLRLAEENGDTSEARGKPADVYESKHSDGFVSTTPDEEPGFRFPDDHAGALLAKTLRPSEMRPIVARTAEPLRNPGSPRVEAPSLPLPASRLDLPRVTLVKRQAPQPHLLKEEVYFVTHADLLLPAEMVLLAADRVRVPSVDVNKPIPLPILAKPSSERAPVDDVTIEASNAAALSATMPARTKPAPFLKATVPDPFEHRKPVAPPVTQTEEVPNTTPTLPKK